MPESSSSGEGSEVEINLGAAFTATAEQRKYIFKWPIDNTMRRGTIRSDGNQAVYFGWNKELASVDDSDEVDKGHIPAAGGSLRVPRKCNFFYAATAAGQSKCVIVED